MGRFSELKHRPSKLKIEGNYQEFVKDNYDVRGGYE